MGLKGWRLTTIDPGLLEMMQCPISRRPLVQAGDWLYATDPATRRKYPIRDGLPIMLVEESAEASREEFERVMAAART
jgi:uncharacterized protein YbaR (Trm112 family)